MDLRLRRPSFYTKRFIFVEETNQISKFVGEIEIKSTV